MIGASAGFAPAAEIRQLLVCINCSLVSVTTPGESPPLLIVTLTTDMVQILPARPVVANVKPRIERHGQLFTSRQIEQCLPHFELRVVILDVEEPEFPESCVHGGYLDGSIICEVYHRNFSLILPFGSAEMLQFF